jgi:hypothetical protein
MKGINAKKAEKKKRAAEKKVRISTRNNGYSKSRMAQPPRPPRDHTVPRFLSRHPEVWIEYENERKRITQGREARKLSHGRSRSSDHRQGAKVGSNHP